MIRTVMSAWAAFAKDPKEGLTRFGWPVYDENSEYYPIFACV
jgi:hypothetical protein